MLCEAFTRSVAAEKGLAAAGALYEELVPVRDQAYRSIRSLRAEFGDQTARECQAAAKEVLNEFGPH